MEHSHGIQYLGMYDYFNANTFRLQYVELNITGKCYCVVNKSRFPLQTYIRWCYYFTLFVSIPIYYFHIQHGDDFMKFEEMQSKPTCLKLGLSKDASTTQLRQTIVLGEVF